MLPKMGGGSNGVGSFTCCVILLLCAVNNVNSYSKYGRGCQDIGCLPSEECIITQDSCNYNLREGKDCGSYPTCKKKYGASSSSAPVPVNPSGSVYNPGIYNPAHLQPVNPYKPSFVFGQQPYYSPPAGTGGPPNNNGGGGLAPYYGGNLPQPNMFNKPPPQYQNQNQYPNGNQNTYNRQTQSSHHRYSDATRLRGGLLSSVSVVLIFSCLGYVLNAFLMQQWSFAAQRT